MSSPFPGMDPYLEDRQHWHSFHHLISDEIMAQLNQSLGEKYYADVEVTTSLEEIGISTGSSVYPDAAIIESNPWVKAPTATLTAPSAPIYRVAMPAAQIKQRTVYVYLTSSKTLVTAIEILSPVNKSGAGLEEYRQKRSRILRSDVHLVEIDLLRGGQRPGWEVNEPLPLLPIPLLFPDPDIDLDLRQALDAVYNRAAYARRIDYSQSIPPPKPRPAITDWLTTVGQ